MIGVISAAIAPGLALLLYIYLRDKYETEPIGVVIKSFIIGAYMLMKGVCRCRKQWLSSWDPFLGEALRRSIKYSYNEWIYRVQ